MSGLTKICNFYHKIIRGFSSSCGIYLIFMLMLRWGLSKLLPNLSLNLVKFKFIIAEDKSYPRSHTYLYMLLQGYLSDRAISLRHRPFGIRKHGQKSKIRIRLDHSTYLALDVLPKRVTTIFDNTTILMPSVINLRLSSHHFENDSF